MAGNFDGDDRTYIINERNLTVDKVVTTLISSTNFDVYTSTFNKSHNPGVVLYITPFDQIPSADLCNVKFIYIFFLYNSFVIPIPYLLNNNEFISFDIHKFHFKKYKSIFSSIDKKK